MELFLKLVWGAYYIFLMWICGKGLIYCLKHSLLYRIYFCDELIHGGKDLLIMLGCNFAVIFLFIIFAAALGSLIKLIKS